MRKTIVSLAVAAFIATLSTTALASGFYMSPLAEAVFLLFFTPVGWACAALLVVVMVVLIVLAAKRWSDGGST